MALKRKITKVEYDKLSDELKKAYKAGEYSDTFVLDLGDEHDDDDPEEMRRALAREREDRKKAQKELKLLKEKQGEGDDEGEGEGDDEGEADPPPQRGRPRSTKRANEDAAKIDRDWKKRFDKSTNDFNAKLSAKDEFIKKSLIGKTAEVMAAKISTSPELLADQIAKRLTVDFDGDEPELVILGEDGKPASISLEKLEKEFVANKKFASIIIGSKASGGGAPKTSTEFQPGGGAPASVTDLSKMPAKELAAHFKARKEAAAT